MQEEEEGNASVTGGQLSAKAFLVAQVSNLCLRGQREQVENLFYHPITEALQKKKKKKHTAEGGCAT